MMKGQLSFSFQMLSPYKVTEVVLTRQWEPHLTKAGYIDHTKASRTTQDKPPICMI